MLPEREGLLEVIRAAAARAAAKNGKVVVVQGEAGIGKTSLLRAFAAQQGRRGRILWGWCEALFVPRPLRPEAGRLLTWRLLRSARAEAAGADMPPPRLWLELFAQGAAVAFLAPQSASLFTIAFLVVFRGHDRTAARMTVTTSMSMPGTR